MKWDGDFAGPFAFCIPSRYEPARIPGQITETGLTVPAAVVDDQSKVGGEIAVDVNQELDPVVGREIGIAGSSSVIDGVGGEPFIEAFN